MIVKSRRREGWWKYLRTGRLRRSLRNHRVLDEAQFALALEKERCRSERRDLCFSVIQCVIGDSPKRNHRLGQLFAAFRQRLRITDEIGWFHGGLCVLLPETSPLDAGKVANDLVGIAASLDVQMETEILVYPQPTSDVVPELAGHNGNGQLHTGNGEHSNKAGQGVPTNGQATSPHAAEFRLLNFQSPTPIWKRSLDLLGSGLGLIVLSPVLAAAAIAVWMTTPGPVFFSQLREGKDGRRFRIYKFRTMRLGADNEKQHIRVNSEQDGPAFKIKNDPRITLVGRYLRMSCVDELPQLLNVLKGEMSLVGPRPLPVDESILCSPWQRRRLEVLPGMTCIWQVDGGRDIPFDHWMRMDRQYMLHCSLATDIKLLCKTAKLSLLHRGSV